MNESERGTIAVDVERPHDQGRGILFGEDQTRSFQARWDAIQARFVDEPRDAVQQADGLVRETTERLTTIFTDERVRLEADWAQKGDVSTEDLRQALRRYRAFFDRLLGV